MLPSKIKDWCNFEFSEEYILSLSHKENLNGLHNKNLTSPNITISSLLVRNKISIYTELGYKSKYIPLAYNQLLFLS